MISPEMLQSREFIQHVLQNPRFNQRVLSLVIDEAHCISIWGAQFRKKYATLGVVRAFLPRNTPAIAMSATLTHKVRRDIHLRLRFPKFGSRYLNIGNDRSNVSYVVRACEDSLNTYVDIDKTVLPEVVTVAEDIPKAYVYVNNIDEGNEIIDHLSKVLATRRDKDGTPTTVQRGVIRPFNAHLSHEYRTEAMAQFRAGNIRILVCTDAAGMVSM